MAEADQSRNRVQPGTITLTTQIGDVVGVPPKVAQGLAGMGLFNVGRLIAHLPMRHEVEEAETTIDGLEAGAIATARGEITATRPSPRFVRRPKFEVVVADDTGRLDVVWFNMPWLSDRLHPGERIRVQGKPVRTRTGLRMTNPRWELIEGTEPGSRDARLRPVYPASEGVASRQIEAAIGLILDPALGRIEDHLPSEFVRAREMPALADAYRMLHRPDAETDVTEGRRRLAYDELLLLQLAVHIKRAHLRRALRAPALRVGGAVDTRIRARLPFALTPEQDKVVAEIARDLGDDVPTNRLIQGDVGSGKTAVALYAMLAAVASGHQAALMAPTELLAEQHLSSLTRTLAGSDVRLELLTGSLAPDQRDGVLARLEAGQADLVVGTHALLTERVRFHSLALAVIDEQHRFGVHQRAALRVKGMGQQAPDAHDPLADTRPQTPHVLVMTATPIPRTIGLTVFGDLDISTIEGLPPGRKPVETRVARPEDRGDVYRLVRDRLDAGRQAYVVVPAIDTGATAGDGELRDLRSVAEELERGALAGRRLASVHGRLARATRETIMERFRAGTIECLVATTVIEVGVDVPNATVMVIEHAERFGLAQLHQLRGRVGRGEQASLCVLIGEPRTDDARTRLEVMAETSSGFALAERDLAMRGPGEVVGARQAGAAPFQVADLATDLDLLTLARKDAAAWIDRSPVLDRPGEAILRRRLLKTHGASMGIADVG